MPLSGFLWGLFCPGSVFWDSWGILWQLKLQVHFLATFFDSFWGVKMDTWRAVGEPWEAHGPHLGGHEACLKPLFYESGEHEQTLVYTVFAPHYGPQGAPILAPKASQRRPEWSKVVTEACKSV